MAILILRIENIIVKDGVLSDYKFNKLFFTDPGIKEQMKSYIEENDLEYSMKELEEVLINYIPDFIIKYLNPDYNGNLETTFDVLIESFLNDNKI